MVKGSREGTNITSMNVGSHQSYSRAFPSGKRISYVSYS